jgi:two-component system, OmpR family, sensor histidine kinase TctE
MTTSWNPASPRVATPVSIPHAAPNAAGPAAGGKQSLRQQLLLGIGVPVVLLLLANAFTLYYGALAAANTAYDRSLLASAKAIGELLEVDGSSGQARLKATLTYAALEAFEADNRSRLYYKVTGFEGEMASGFADLPLPQASAGAARANAYAALVQFYDDLYQNQPVRMAVLLQPVAGAAGQGMATIQVAETLELRHTLARQLLLQTLWQQALLLLVIAGVVLWVVQRATAPLRHLSHSMRSRAETDLSALHAPSAPYELHPMVDAINTLMSRLAQLLEHQRRFVRDASHQLRTPLAVLKAQVQSARRGDVSPELALTEINTTVERATELANQLLALAKVEQIRPGGAAAAQTPLVDWAHTVREVALDVSPLIAQKQLDFELEMPTASASGRPANAHSNTQAHAQNNAPSGPLAPVRAHEWALRELTRNLMHNAIKHGPPGSRLQVSLRVHCTRGLAELCVADAGAGLSEEQQLRLFQPFAASGHEAGSGLGLAICHEIVLALAGSISLNNRGSDGRVSGLDAVVRLPLHPPADPP